MTDDVLWDTVFQLRDWLDDASSLAPDVRPLIRVVKLSEEVGEVAQAIIGMYGENPRKRYSHTAADVEGELCDVIITALVALATLTPDAKTVFAERFAAVASRALDVPAQESAKQG